MPGHDVESACLRYDCWIAETSQWPPRTRMKVHTSVASSGPPCSARPLSDRKSTRLNSSHLVISYAVFCLKKKKKKKINLIIKKKKKNKKKKKQKNKKN